MSNHIPIISGLISNSSNNSALDNGERGGILVTSSGSQNVTNLSSAPWGNVFPTRNLEDESANPIDPNSITALAESSLSLRFFFKPCQQDCCHS